MRKVMAAVAAATIIVVAGCGGEGAGGAGTDTTVVETSTTTAEPETTTTAPLPAVMPDVLCLPLNQARDDIRAARLTAIPVDASGRDRVVLRYSNWFVVAQESAAGIELAAESEVVVGVIKFDDPGATC